LLSKRKGDGFIKEDWFVGVEVVNLQHIIPVSQFMASAMEPLKKSAKELRRVDRSDKREASDNSMRRGSAMYEVGGGPRVDQTGHLQAPHNFKRLKDTLSKYDLMKEDDDILDGVIAVNSYFVQVQLTLDYKSLSPVAHSNLDGGNH